MAIKFRKSSPVALALRTLERCTDSRMFGEARCKPFLYPDNPAAKICIDKIIDSFWRDSKSKNVRMEKAWKFTYIKVRVTVGTVIESGWTCGCWIWVNAIRFANTREGPRWSLGRASNCSCWSGCWGCCGSCCRSCCSGWSCCSCRCSCCCSRGGGWFRHCWNASRSVNPVGVISNSCVDIGPSWRWTTDSWLSNPSDSHYCVSAPEWIVMIHGTPIISLKFEIRFFQQS